MKYLTHAKVTFHEVIVTFLTPLALLYSCVMKLRRWAFKQGLLKSHRLPGKVISIGNIEVGGTGKSPVTIELAKLLLAQGYKPAIVTRGYRSGLSSKQSATLLDKEYILPAEDGRSIHADEAMMQSAHLPQVPIILGANRWSACQRYLEHYSQPTHWILDDGFQHLKLKRDIDVLLMDYKKPLSNGWTIPSGRLREPVSAIKSASIILLTRSSGEQLPAELSNFGPITYFCPFKMSEPKFVNPIATTATFSFCLVAGIAKPDQLIQGLKDQGTNIVDTLILRDHSPIPKEDLETRSEICDAFVTTEKDYFRDPQLFEDLKKPVAIVKLRADLSSVSNTLLEYISM